MIEFCDIICANLLQKTWFEILATGFTVISSLDFHSSCLTMIRTSIPIIVLDDASCLIQIPVVVAGSKIVEIRFISNFLYP